MSADLEIAGAVMERKRVHTSVKMMFNDLMSAREPWCARAEEVLRQKRPLAADPSALVLCVEMDLESELWPDRLIQAFEDFANGARMTEFAGYDALGRLSDALVAEFGSEKEARRRAELLRQREAYHLMRRLCWTIPDDIRELAFANWDGDLTADVLLHLVCFPDYYALLQTNPLLARIWAMKHRGGRHHFELWSNEALMRAREAELAEGARALLARIGLPPERKVLKLLNRIQSPFGERTCSRELECLFANSGRRSLDRLSQVGETIPGWLLGHLCGMFDLPHPSLISDFCRDGIIEPKFRSGSFRCYEDTCRMLRQLGRSYHHLNQIQSIEELRAFHDRLAAAAYQPRPAVIRPFSADAPIAPMEGMTAITDDKQLERAAKRFRNCSGFYAERIQRGSYAIYTVGEAAMIGLKFDSADGQWHLDEISAPGNMSAPERVTKQVEQWLSRSRARIAG